MYIHLYVYIHIFFFLYLLSRKYKIKITTQQINDLPQNQFLEYLELLIVVYCDNS